VNTIINLEYIMWYIKGCCRQWEKLAKRHSVIVLAWGAANWRTVDPRGFGRGPAVAPVPPHRHERS